jgi:UDP-2-acetamido-3-amino-2,3-dideoxy-glucuronate N-acetyltransferase
MNIDTSARLGKAVGLGSNVRIGPYVQIGDNTIIGNNVVIHADTIIGNDVRIDDNAVLGKLPVRAATSAIPVSANLPRLEVGDGCHIGAGSVIYRGCTLGANCLVADLATIRENVTIGRKTIVGRGVAVENYCRIGSFCKLETNCYITAYSTLGNHVFIAPGVVTSNDNYAGRGAERFKHFKGVTVEDGGRIGANATILPGRIIGSQALVGAGAVVTRDLPPGKVMVGNPGRIVRDVPAEQMLTEQELKVD